MTAAAPVLLLAPEDNVLIAVVDLAIGQRVTDGEREIVLTQAVPLGHKLARQPIRAGAKIIKYGAAIGSATRAIAEGEWVHLHNLASDYLATPVLEESRASPVEDHVV